MHYQNIFNNIQKSTSQRTWSEKYFRKFSHEKCLCKNLKENEGFMYGNNIIIRMKQLQMIINYVSNKEILLNKL